MQKLILYCWFGGKEKPQTVKECMKTWCYESLEINESVFDINSYKFTQKAYNEGKWAFVSDVARLWALYNIGGIYLDTDVEILKNLDEFLHLKAFTGFENIGYPITALFGAEKGNKLIKEMLDYYENKEFEYLGYGKMKTNTMILSDILEQKGINRFKNEKQTIDDITIFPKNYFCGQDKSIYANHKMLGSWG